MPDMSRGFDFLRVSLESHLTGPSVITVTSARDDDGATMVATGLAESFAAAGKTTLLVSTHGASIASSGRTNLVRMTASQLSAELPGGRTTITAAVGAQRTNYAITIVDAEPISSSALALELAREADAVLVAIRLGRKPGPEDHTTKKLLDASGSKVAGIVPTHAFAIDGAPYRSVATDAAGTRVAPRLEATR